MTRQDNANGTSSSFVVSDDGLRRRVTENGATTLMVWDGTRLLQEKDSTTKAEVTRYLLQNDSYSGLRAQRQASATLDGTSVYDNELTSR